MRRLTLVVLLGSLAWTAVASAGEPAPQRPRLVQRWADSLRRLVRPKVKPQPKPAPRQVIWREEDFLGPVIKEAPKAEHRNENRRIDPRDLFGDWPDGP